MNIRIGDKVRFIYKKYYDFGKDEAYQTRNWEKYCDDASGLVIGGEYTVTAKRNLIFTVYQLNGKYYVDKNNLMRSNCVILCPYQIGEDVIFSPKCSAEELYYLNVVCPNLIKGHKYQILNIVNSYYLIVDVKYPNEWIKTNSNYTKNESIPLRWIDFEKA